VSDTADIRQKALQKAVEATEQMERLGVTIEIIGSLAKGTFGPGSDIDFLVRKCPAELVYAIEGKIEDIVHPFAFDVVYFNEIPPHKMQRLTSGAADARTIR